MFCCQTGVVIKKWNFLSAKDSSQFQHQNTMWRNQWTRISRVFSGFSGPGCEDSAEKFRPLLFWSLKTSTKTFNSKNAVSCQPLSRTHLVLWLSVHRSWIAGVNIECDPCHFGFAMFQGFVEANHNVIQPFSTLSLMVYPAMTFNLRMKRYSFHYQKSSKPPFFKDKKKSIFSEAVCLVSLGHYNNLNCQNRLMEWTSKR